MRRSTLGTWLSMSVLAAFQGLAAGQQPAAQIDPGAMQSWQSNVDEKVRLLSAAYSLDVDLSATLRAELTARIYDQVAWEDKFFHELDGLLKLAEAAGNREDSPEMQAVWAKMAEHEQMPLSDGPVVEWLETKVPPQVAVEGRARWTELRDYVEEKRYADMEEDARPSGLKAEVSKAIVQGSGHVAEQVELPLPNDPPSGRYYPEIVSRSEQQGVVSPKLEGQMSTKPGPSPERLAKIERKQIEQQQAQNAQALRKRGDMAADAPLESSAGEVVPRVVVEQPPAPQVTVQVAPTTPPPAVRAPQPSAVPREIEYAKAPPLDDWDKYVQEQARKHGYDEAQFIKAQSILKDLKRRANQYRMSRADMFSHAALKADAKARDEALRDLNRPIDAMFEELKQRVESLMTIEQRERAKAGAAGKRP
jgi:hypothetical protein